MKLKSISIFLKVLLFSSLLFLFVNAALISYGRLWADSNELSQNNPTLTIPDDLTVAAGDTITVPITFQANGASVTSIFFSIDIDQECLSFDETDTDADLIPDTVKFNIPNQHTGSVTYEETDLQGEFDFTIADFRPPLATVPSAPNLVEIVLLATCQPAPNSTITAHIQFSSSPNPSFGDPDGFDIIGETQDGQVSIVHPVPTGTPTVTPTGTTASEPTGTPTGTPTVTPTGTTANEPTGTPTVTPTGTTANEPTGTPTVTPTATTANEPTGTPTVTLTGTTANELTGTTANEPTGTPTVTPTATTANEPTGTPTVTPTATTANEPTGTPTATPTGTIATEPAGTPTVTPTATLTGTITNEPTGTPTVTPTGTIATEPTGTPTATPTGTTATEPTGTPTVTPTGTIATEPTGTPTVTPTGTIATEPTGTVTSTATTTPTIIPPSADTTPTVTATALDNTSVTPRENPAVDIESDPIANPIDVFDPVGPTPERVGGKADPITGEVSDPRLAGLVFKTKIRSEGNSNGNNESQKMIPGSAAIFEMSFENNSIHPLYGMVIRSTIPTSTTFRQAGSDLSFLDPVVAANRNNNRGTEWELPDLSGLCPDGASAGTECIFRIGTLQPGERGELSLSTTINQDAPADIELILKTNLVVANLEEGLLITINDDARIQIIQETSTSVGQNSEPFSGKIFLPLISR